MSQFTISGSPHVHGEENVKKIMYTVVLALVPAILVSTYFFGIDAIRILLIAVISCLFFEWVIQKYLIKGTVTITDGSAVVAGIIFGGAIPEKKPLVFCDGVYGSFASTSETSIGAITLAEKATRIVGIMADLNHGDTVTIGQAVAGYIRITSDDVDLNPGMYPCTRAFDAADGTPVGACSIPKSEFIPVDIEVPGGATINILGTTTQSVTGNADFSVFIAYE